VSEGEGLNGQSKTIDRLCQNVLYCVYKHALALASVDSLKEERAYKLIDNYAAWRQMN